MNRAFLLIIFCCLSVRGLGQELDKWNQAKTYFEKAASAFENDQQDSLNFHLTQGRALFLDLGVDSTYLEAGLGLAQTFYRGRDYEQGIALLLQLEEDLKENFSERDPTQTALNYQLARGYYYLLKVKPCIDRVQANLPNLDSTSVLYANHLNILGLILYKNAQPQEALPYQEKVLDLRKVLYGPESSNVANILTNLGNTCIDMGLLNRAYDYLEAALAIYEKLFEKEDERLVAPLINLGVIYDETGQFRRSLDCYEEALTILNYPGNQDDDLIAIININEAATYKNLGAFEEARLYSEKAEKLLEKVERTDKNILLGDLYINFSNSRPGPEASARYREKADQEYKKTLQTSHPKRIAIANNVAVNYIKEGEYQKARDTLFSLVRIIEKADNNSFQLANVYNDLADTFYESGELSEAIRYNEQALNLQKKLYPDGHYRLSYTYNNLAKIALKQGDLEQANAHLDRALVNNQAADLSTESFRNYKYYLETLLLKGQANPLSEALVFYEVADRLLSRLRNELNAVEDKIALADFSFRLSKQAVAACLSGPKNSEMLEKAYYYSEQSKANVLSQLLALNQGKSFAGIPDSLIQREEALLATIHYYELKLADENNQDHLELYQNELFNARLAHRELLAYYEKEFPDYFDLKYKNEIPGLTDLQQILEEQTAMISYFTTDEKVYSFVIHAGEVEVHEKKITQDFFTSVKGFAKTITLRLDEDYATIGARLYEYLFDFNLPKSTEKLIIVPDSRTSQIPFGALLTKAVPAKALDNMTKLPYLIKDFEISYTPSARIFYQQNQREVIYYNNELLAYAPVFSTPQPITDFGESQGTRLSDNVQIVRSLVNDRDEIAPLPGTLSELENIAQVFDEKSKNAKVYLYDKATEGSLKMDLKENYRFVHIATHGFVNTEQPDLSGLIFYGDESKQEDNVLYSAEIYNLNFNAELVTLSACETGLGEAVEGEGLLGLSRAFTYAGARNLLVTLWKIQDQATSDLMVQFYRSYWSAPEQGFSHSLRAAKLSLIDSPTYADPYYWSSFILLGK